MEAFVALVGLLGSVVGLVLFLVQRKQAPTTPERLDDADDGFRAMYEQIEKLRERGDDAGAESLRAQLLRRYGLDAPSGDQPGDAGQ